MLFETDCSNLQNAVTSSSYDLSQLGVLFSDMRFQIRINFLDASVVFAPTGCNKPAHELAALGVGVAAENQVFWTSSYPSIVTRLVTSDSAVS